MSKAEAQVDVLVLGEHPAAYLCALLLQGSKLKVLQATLPAETTHDRLLIVNPELFRLHPLLDALRRKVELKGIYGLQFLSDQPDVVSEHRSRSAMAYVGSYKALRSTIVQLVSGQQVPMLIPKELQLHRLDEMGVEATVGKTHVRAKALVLAGLPSEDQCKLLGLPDGWGHDIVHRYTFLRLSGAKCADLGGRPVIPMSLNLCDQLCWAWLIPGPKWIELAIEQPLESVARTRGVELLSRWIGVLQAHNILAEKANVRLDDARWIDLPLAGALAHEGVANRTLLIGPAGGFYSSTAEDIYPNCWSAIYAVEVLKKALKEHHLQDALNPYRHRWRTTLGEYLRGPQQNLRFLLPLVYRNQVMTTRLTESILLGKSVVR